MHYNFIKMYMYRNHITSYENFQIDNELETEFFFNAEYELTNAQTNNIEHELLCLLLVGEKVKVGGTNETERYPYG